MGRRIAAVLLLGAVIGACVSDTKSPYVRDGVKYGVTRGVFRGRWWSYFERGSSFMAGGFYKEAVSDYEKALAGRNRDSWRARTYGLHFVEYFPNRELGVARYHLGEYDAAEKLLQRSLEQIDTERGHYYLDLVKKAKIAQGLLEDTSEPEVGVVLPKAEIIASRELSFKIDAKDDVGVAAVKVNGEKLHQRGSKEQVDFQKEVTLDEGKHEIEVAAVDLADKEVIQKVEVTVDLTGPTIGVFAPIEPTVTPEGTVLLEGATVDKNGVTAVTVDERILSESEGVPRLEFDSELPLGDGENTFILAARDVAGNETRSAIKVFKGNPESPEAKLWLLQQKYPERMKLASANPAAIDLLLSAVSEEGEKIRLKSPDPSRPYRHNRTLRVAGEVVTRTKVAALTINGEPFTDLTGAPKESFNKRIPIDIPAGDTSGQRITVAIHAEEEGGAALDKQFEVEVRPVELASRESRMPVAVLAFAGQGLEPAASERLRLTTEAQMIEQNRFRVLDRSRLQDVLNEQQLAAALADPNQAISLGKVTPAQIFVVADVFNYEQKGLELKARVISTETSDLLKTLDVFIDDRENAQAVKQGCDALAAQLAQLFPRLSGEIVSVRDQELLVNWTTEDGVREGAYLLVVQEQAPWIDESTGEVLEPGEFVEVGRAKILTVSPTGSKARTVERKEEGVTFEKGMPAITM